MVPLASAASWRSVYPSRQAGYDREPRVPDPAPEIRAILRPATDAFRAPTMEMQGEVRCAVLAAHASSGGGASAWRSQGG
jgi:hypothetical protein